MIEQGKMPIIVGGTNYYIESIVYKILVEDTLDTDNLLWDKSKRKRDFEGEENLSKKTTAELNSNDSEDIEQINLKEKSNCDAKIEVSKEKMKEDVDNESKFTNEEIHERLKMVDPEMASRLHPNNRRKVLR